LGTVRKGETAVLERYLFLRVRLQKPRQIRDSWGIYKFLITNQEVTASKMTGKEFYECAKNPINGRF